MKFALINDIFGPYTSLLKTHWTLYFHILYNLRGGFLWLLYYSYL